MKKILTLIVGCSLLMVVGCTRSGEERVSADAFVRVSGTDLIRPDGSKLFIKGTNLGNWLNPEGYMFGFDKTNSAHFIDEMVRQLVGPDAANQFWLLFKENYITRADIDYIKQAGCNTIRLPFHYKLFTDEDYMGMASNRNEGFVRIDALVEWCRDAGLYLILDMHDAPGGQTGDNIDDSYGYPWLFESKASQALFADIWQRIARRYKDEPVILGYELMNEPIAPYFDNMDSLNLRLASLYKIGVEAIRKEDPHHIILLGGAQWNSNFAQLYDTRFDKQIMYTCHRYGGEPTTQAIGHFIQFRDSVQRPMYMGEIGHNTDEWMAAFCRTMETNNIGWTFWPYKKVDNSAFMGIRRPERWDSLVVRFAEAPRTTYKEIREVRPDHTEAMQALMQFVEAARFENCEVQQGYIRALGLNPLP
ncbi:MAG: glycoside hydrolase family 5 protein [Mediterranea sp.]|nr:glycoside hydrolase family 5 protein [Mediterranea sp.]